MKKSSLNKLSIQKRRLSSSLVSCQHQPSGGLLGSLTGSPSLASFKIPELKRLGEFDFCFKSSDLSSQPEVGLTRLTYLKIPFIFLLIIRDFPLYASLDAVFVSFRICSTRQDRSIGFWNGALHGADSSSVASRAPSKNTSSRCSLRDKRQQQQRL